MGRIITAVTKKKEYMRTSELLPAACTTFDRSTFELYASLAKVVVVLPGTYLGQFGAGAAAGFLAKLPTIVSIVAASVFSAAVAVEG
jgi:hypothetical protein